MTDKTKPFAAGRRAVGFRSGAAAVNLFEALHVQRNIPLDALDLGNEQQ